MAQSEKEMVMEIKLKDELKVCKLKMEMLKDGIKKERVEKEGLKKEAKELKEKNAALEGEQKKKDEKYQQSLGEIRELKSMLLAERNQKEKLMDQVSVLSGQIKQQEAGGTPGGGWSGYLGGLLKR